MNIIRGISDHMNIIRGISDHMNKRRQRAAAKARERDISQVRGSVSTWSDSKLTESISYHRAGQLAEANRLYAEILSREPKNVVALHLLGAIKHQEGDVRQAIELIGNAIALRPDYVEAHYNLGNAFRDQGMLEEAVAAYREALKIKPDYALAHNNLGIALKDQGRLAEAVAAYREALKFKPDFAMVHNNLGIALGDQGRLEEAVAAYHKALELKPDYAEAYSNLGIALGNQGRRDKAVAAYHKALALKPDFAEAHYNLGNALKEQGRLKEAVAAYQMALKFKPDYTVAYNNLGIVLGDQGRLKEAVATYHKALKIRPNYTVAHINLGNALKYQGRLAEAVAAYRTALELKPDDAEAHSNLIFTMNYDVRFSQEDIFAESRRWDGTHAKPHSRRERIHVNNQDPDRRLRVGYVSPDFREHSVSHFVEPLMAGHDHRAFEVFCYAHVVKPDDKTARFRDLANVWCSTVGVTDSAVAERIHEDGIDILVDLAGHTANNRLLVFAERPAPVQITWLGYPNTTGLAVMDYRLTDVIADPEGAADSLYTETLVRLPNGFLCFAPPADAPEVGESPAVASGYVTFGSFNKLSKVTPEVAETWARILERVPRSRLLIKSRSLADEETQARYLEMFGAYGIDVGRVDLRCWIESKSGHLGNYGQVDIGLDSFPYNGTTTTCEALWMGVPVVTLRGDRHSGRVGASILTRIGLMELVAETKDAYVEKAAGLANSLDQLSGLRKDLRSRMQGSPICDSHAFTRDVEAVYRELWRQWCNAATKGVGGVRIDS